MIGDAYDREDTADRLPVCRRLRWILGDLVAGREQRWPRLVARLRKIREDAIDEAIQERIDRREEHRMAMASYAY